MRNECGAGSAPLAAELEVRAARSDWIELITDRCRRDVETAWGSDPAGGAAIGEGLDYGQNANVVGVVPPAVQVSVPISTESTVGFLTNSTISFAIAIAPGERFVMSSKTNVGKSTRLDVRYCKK